MIAFTSVLAIVTVAFVQLALWLFTLPAGGTIVAAMILVPILSIVRYRFESGQPLLAFVRGHRPPHPPERFYWVTIRGRLLRTLRAAACTAPVWWIFALEFPADLVLTPESILGWITGALAILTTSIALATSWLYTVAAQRVDSYLPWFIGYARRALYRLSHNPDFL